MTTEDILRNDPTLTHEEAEEIARTVNRYAPCMAEAELEKEEV